MRSLVPLLYWLLALAASAAASAALPAGDTPASSRRVFYVNSYHPGYPASDEVTAAIREACAADGTEFRIAYLDAKRAPAALVERAARELHATIEAFAPDVLIVSDDNAVQSLVVPFYRHGPRPVLFCGVNWACDAYGLPTAFVRGMLEVVPVFETLDIVAEARPGLRRLAIVSEDSVSERANQRILDPLFRARGLVTEWRLVKTFAEWREAFVQAQAADVVYLPTNGGISGWDVAAAKTWVQEHARKPVLACDDFMMPYAMFGLTKVAREQGEWAARAALDLVHGRRTIADIELTRNRQTRTWLNRPLAGRIGLKLPAHIEGSANAPAER